MSIMRALAAPSFATMAVVAGVTLAAAQSGGGGGSGGSSGGGAGGSSSAGSGGSAGGSGSGATGTGGAGLGAGAGTGMGAGAGAGSGGAAGSGAAGSGQPNYSIGTQNPSELRSGGGDVPRRGTSGEGSRVDEPVTPQVPSERFTCADGTVSRIGRSGCLGGG